MYLYHFVPEHQAGNILYPLNQLKEINPNLFKTHSAKYEDLKEKDVEIAGFGYWNDCINLMPVSPGLVKKELEKFGHDTNWSWKFYEIDANRLVWSNLIIMLSTDNADVGKRKFVEFSKENYEKYSHIGNVTRYRYQKARGNGEQPNTFAGIPHVLYKGSIKTDNLNVVEF